MPPARILVDTNTYLRLARTIKPLLGVPFGEPGHCLCILPELERELAALQVKKRKFRWAAEAVLAENRRRILQFSSQQRRTVEAACVRTQSYADEEGFSRVSEVDVRYIAHGRALGIPVATDDQEMLLLAAAVDVEGMTTLELLRLMLDCGHVTARTVDEICAHWERTDDLPANFLDDYRRLFGRDDGETGKAP